MLKNGIFCEMVILVIFKGFLLVKNLEILVQIGPDRSIYSHSSLACKIIEKSIYYQWQDYLNPLMANVPHHIKTSQIKCKCIANQMTGFYMMRNTGR